MLFSKRLPRTQRQIYEANLKQQEEPMQRSSHKKARTGQLKRQAPIQEVIEHEDYKIEKSIPVESPLLSDNKPRYGSDALNGLDLDSPSEPSFKQILSETVCFQASEPSYIEKLNHEPILKTSLRQSFIEVPRYKNFQWTTHKMRKPVQDINKQIDELYTHLNQIDDTINRCDITSTVCLVVAGLVAGIIQTIKNTVKMNNNWKMALDILSAVVPIIIAAIGTITKASKDKAVLGVSASSV